MLLEAATSEAAKSSSSLSVVSLSPFLHFHSFSAPSLFLKDQYDSHTYTEPFKVVLLGGLFFLNSSTLSLLTTSIHCRSSHTKFTSSSKLPPPSPSSSPLDAMPANVRITPHVTSHTPQCNALWLRCTYWTIVVAMIFFPLHITVMHYNVYYCTLVRPEEHLVKALLNIITSTL